MRPIWDGNVCLGSPNKSSVARPERIEPQALGFEDLDDTSQGVSSGSKLLENQRVTHGDLSRVSPEIAPSSQPFGAIVVQASEAEGSGSANISPLLTVREVAARLRVCTATVYSLCEIGALAHVRLNNAIRVAEGDLRQYLEKVSKRPG